MMRKIGWTMMAVLAILVALYAASLVVLPAAGPPFVAERRVSMPLALYAHLIGSLWALVAGPFQLNQRLRAASLVRHRWLGRSYVVGVMVAG